MSSPSGDYQHLNYATSVIELSIQWAAIADKDNVGLDSWLINTLLEGSRMGIIDKGRSCYDLILHSLSVYKELYTKNPGRDDLEDIRNHAYQLTFSAEYAMFHSQLYDWIVLHGMTDTRLERELALLAKYELLWGLHVKND